MKRQPIVSAAAFFVLGFLIGESDSSLGESADKLPSPTDGICRGKTLY